MIFAIESDSINSIMRLRSGALGSAASADARTLLTLLLVQQAAQGPLRVVTELLDSADIELAMESGGDDYLVKPCDQGELMARVRAGLRIVLLTKKLQAAALEWTRLQADVTRVRAELRTRGIEWPAAPESLDDNEGQGIGGEKAA